MLTMRDPFATLLAVQRALDATMRSDWFGPWVNGAGAYPRINVFRRGDDFVLTAELPGVRKEDLDVQVKGDRVRIRGERTVSDAEDASVHRRERSDIRFDRTLQLPAEIDAEKVSAEYRDGVLTLSTFLSSRTSTDSRSTPGMSISTITASAFS